MDDFTKMLVGRLKEGIGDEGTVVMNEVEKVNDQRLHGISIYREGQAVSRCFYAEYIYKRVQEGTELSEIIEEILKVDHGMDEKSLQFMEDIFNYELIKDRLIVKVLNRQMNEDYLKGKAYCEKWT